MREILTFYKYSFIYQAGFNLLLFAAIYVLKGFQLGNSFSFLGVFLWFLCFYLLPTWLAGTLIYLARRAGIRLMAVEVNICILCFIGGLHLLTVAQEFSFGRSFVRDSQISVIGLTWALVFYFCGRFLESRYKLKHSKELMLDAQREALIFQLNPHFLFNGLNTISAYIHSKPDLADVLRYSLDTKSRNLVTLEEELDALQKYFAIEKFRFGENLSFELSIDERLKSTELPPLLIQPAIENAIKHGENNGKFFIKIDSGIDGNRAWIQVKDSGAGFSSNILSQFNKKNCPPTALDFAYCLKEFSFYPKAT